MALLRRPGTSRRLAIHKTIPDQRRIISCCAASGMTSWCSSLPMHDNNLRALRELLSRLRSDL